MSESREHCVWYIDRTENQTKVTAFGILTGLKTRWKLHISGM